MVLTSMFFSISLSLSLSLKRKQETYPQVRIKENCHLNTQLIHCSYKFRTEYFDS